MAKQCDIIIPFHNGLNYRHDCIESVLRNTHYPYRLLLINDASDEDTTQKILKYVKKYSHIQMYINIKKLGYLKSCNIGIKMSKAPYVVILNSDTYVLPFWLIRHCL